MYTISEAREWSSPETRGEGPSPRSIFGLAATGSHIFVHGGMLDFGETSSQLFRLSVRFPYQRVTS